eukprot:5067222-Prymnesium_polylepis.1
MTMRELEELLDEKDALVQKLKLDLEASVHELLASRQHLNEHVAELETVRAQLEMQKAQAPPQNLQQHVTQLRQQVRAKERELGRMRDVISQLKEDMELVAKENAERQAKAVKAAAAKADKDKAERQVDEKLGERMLKLQERFQVLQAEVRTLRQKEGAAQKAAGGMTEQLADAEAHVARQSGEIYQLKSELATLKGLQQEAAAREASLKRQLAARTQ